MKRRYLICAVLLGIATAIHVWYNHPFSSIVCGFWTGVFLCAHICLREGCMSEYIIEIPDEYIHIEGQTIYIPDERHDPMSIEPIVRCKNCKHYRDRINGCAEFGDESRGEFANVEPEGYCAWGERLQPSEEWILGFKEEA